MFDYNMKKIRKNKKVPIEILAERRANREIEQLLLGNGFHARTRIKKSKRVYCRKRKHRDLEED